MGSTLLVVESLRRLDADVHVLLEGVRDLVNDADLLSLPSQAADAAGCSVTGSWM